MPGLDLEFWSSKVLSELASKVGKPNCTDHQTVVKGRISFPRVLIVVSTKGELPSEVRFKGPQGELMTQSIVYEWVPRKYLKCAKWGHRSEQCRTKVVQRMVWVQKQNENKTMAPEKQSEQVKNKGRV